MSTPRRPIVSREFQVTWENHRPIYGHPMMHDMYDAITEATWYSQGYHSKMEVWHDGKCVARIDVSKL